MKNENYLKEELYALIKKEDSIFDFIQDACLDGMWYWDVEKPENEWMNDRFWNVLGYDPGKMPHSPSAWQNIINKDDLKIAVENFNKHLENENHPYDQTVRYKHKDGSTVWIRCNGKAIRDKSGKPLRMLGVHTDITQVEAEKEALQKSEERLQLAVEGTGDGLWDWDMETGTMTFSALYEQMLGYEPGDLVPHADTWSNSVHPEDLPQVQQMLGDYLAGNIARYRPETRLQCKDGTWKWILCRGKVTSWNAEGRPIRMVGIHTDITPRKNEDAVIQIRLDMIEYAANHTLDELLTWSLDEAGKILNSPIGFYHFVEADQKTLSLQQWSTQTLKNFCRAEGSGQHYSIDRAGVWVDCVKTLAPVVHNDYESLPHKKGLPPGHAQIIREVVVPVIRKGKVVAILGVGNKPVDYNENDVEILSKLADYTWETIERKRAEIELQSTKDLLARTNRVARIGGWEADHIRQKVSWTDITKEIFEVDADYVPDLKAGINFYKEGESRETIQSLVNRAIETGEGFDVDLQIITARGNELWARSIGHAEIEGNKIVRLYGTFQDIDTDKKNRLRIQKSEESLKNAQQIAKIGSWELDVETNEVTWTEELYKMYGFDPSKPPPPTIEHMNLFIPESWEAFSTSLAKTREHGIPYELELRTVRKDQGNGWMLVRGEAVFDNNNKIIGLQGTAQDITERKELEKLKEDVDRITQHDMKSPLNGIIGIPQILMDEPNITSDQKKFLQMIMDGGHTILNMIHLSLTIYQIEQGTYEYKEENFDLLKTISQCMGDCQSLESCNDNKTITSTNGFEEVYPEKIMVAGEKLLAYSVISNLLKNAVEASPEGSPITIDITRNTSIQLSIHNQGVVPKEIRNTFFNKYTTSGKKGGTGIGTYSAKILSEAQGWSIGMETSWEKGTKVTITIPKIEESLPW